MWYFFVHKKKFDIRIKLISERANGEVMEIFDRAAILNESKEGTPYLRVWGLKRDFKARRRDRFSKRYCCDIGRKSNCCRKS